MPLFIWRNFQLQLPDEWEMLRYDKDKSNGRCVYADRYQHRLELSWRVVSRPPELDKLLDDYKKKWAQEVETEIGESVKVAGWLGFLTTVAGEVHSHFLRYFPDEKTAIELIFLWPEERDKGEEREILTSFAMEPCVDGLRRWAAFGLDFLVSDDLDISYSRIEPGNAQLAFGILNEQGREERFERYAFLEDRLKEPLAAWLKHRLPRGVVQESVVDYTQVGHIITGITGKWYPNFFMRWLRRGKKFASYAWVCPVDKRLYYLHLIEDMTVTQSRAVGVRLACCDDILEVA